MATYQYKFALLADPDVSANQSRGLSLQFNGFALISMPNDKSREKKDWIANQLNGNNSFTLDEVVKKGGTVLYRDISYIVNDGYVRSNDTKYNSAVTDPGSHMFQGLVVEAAEEIKLSYDGKIDRGSCVIEIPLYDTMFGDRIQGEFDVDAIVLYGQAYNTDFYSDTQQGKIERSVPIGIVGFTESARPSLNPSASSDSKTKFTLKIAIQVTGVHNITEAVEDSRAYENWQKFAGTMHVVNDNLLTTSSYVISGHDIAERDNPLYKYDEGIYASSAYPNYNEETIDFKSRLFFTNDVQEDQWDHNVDFGSPARLTILSNASAVNEYRTPQFMLGKVSYEEDPATKYVHGSLDGIVENYFVASGTSLKGQNIPSSGYMVGSVYASEWISKSKPAFDIFSDWLYTEPGIYTPGHSPYVFQENDFASYLSGGNVSDIEKWRDTSACFANGNNLFTHKSIACGDGTNLNTADVISRGNNLIMNSSRVKCYTRNLGKNDDLTLRENRHLYRYNAFIANSQDVDVFQRVIGKNDERGPNNPLTLILNSNYVKVDNRENGTGTFNTEEQARSVMVGCNRTGITNSDNDVLIGTNGWRKRTDFSSVYNDYWSTLTNGKNNIFIGGLFTAKNAKNCRIFGSGSTDSDLNTIEGTDNDGGLIEVDDCFIFGRNCHVYTKRETTEETTLCDEHDVFYVGKGLKNDIRQTNAYLGSGNNGPTILMGWNNQEYYQEGQTKQIVIGSYRQKYSDEIPEFKYNGFEFTLVHPKDPVVWTDGIGDDKDRVQHWIKETELTLQDVKGRTVDYGSEAINLGFLKGRTDANYSKHAFENMGRINLFKLYKLLKHMYWEYGADGKPVVRIQTDPWAGESDTPVSWNAWDRYGQTCLANLVDDNFCYRAFEPQWKANN